VHGVDPTIMQRGNTMTCTRVIVVLTALLLHSGALSQTDVKGGKDHPLLTRMPGYYITSSDVKEFDKYTTAYLPDAEAVWEGKVTKLAYELKQGAKQVSMVQIVRNYENALKKIGAKVLYNEERLLGARIAGKDATTFVHVEAFNDGNTYELVVVEQGGMKQEVMADADALSNSITATGKAEAYGIYFDTGKAMLKPESTPTLEEITKLLKQHPKMALYVVGHTDNEGSLESNLKLSADRAAAVVRALTGMGIRGSRLKSAGLASYCPVASNRTEAGKARNRRVELVEQ